MNYTSILTEIIISAKEGGFTGYFAEFPGALAEGETVDELRVNMRESLNLILNGDN